MSVLVQKEKLQALFEIIESTFGRKRITLNEIQSLTGSIAFCAKAIPPGVNKSFNYITLSKGIK